MRRTLDVIAALAVLVLVGAGSCDGPSTSPRLMTGRERYAHCVGDDRGDPARIRCQTEVWGSTFPSDDERWVCDLMGDRTCSTRDGG